VSAARVALLTASAAILALGGTACGARVSQQDLESKVAEFVQGQTGVGAAVSCPRDLKGTRGEHFTCTTALSGRRTDLDFEFSQDGHFRLLQTRLQ
jgi:hypothetical protein